MSNKRKYIKFFDVAALGNLNPQEMNAYQQSLKVQRDNYSVRQAAVKEGEQKSILKLARKMKNDGEPIDKIIRYTELSKEEIEKL